MGRKGIKSNLGDLGGLLKQARPQPGPDGCSGVFLANRGWGWGDAVCVTRRGGGISAISMECELKQEKPSLF